LLGGALAVRIDQMANGMMRPRWPFWYGRSWPAPNAVARRCGGRTVTLSWALNRNLPGPACRVLANGRDLSTKLDQRRGHAFATQDLYDLIKGVAFGNAAKVQRQIGLGLSSGIFADVDRIERSRTPFYAAKPKSGDRWSNGRIEGPACGPGDV
jgi:hypothetical protein